MVCCQGCVCAGGSWRRPRGQLEHGSSVLVAALLLGFALQMLPPQMTVSRDTHLVGCIPMVPGGFATKAILGLFAITAQSYTATNETLITAIDNALRVIFTIGALGTGLAIPTLLLRLRSIE